VTRGVVDRFRSLPIWKPAPLVGSLLGDSVRYVLAGTVIMVVGFILGYRVGRYAKNADGVDEFQESSDFGTAHTILQVFLKYGPDGEKVIRHIERYSKPGRRVYQGYKDVRRVLDGRTYVSETVQRSLDQRAGENRSETNDPVARLSNREVQILNMIGRGMSSREIAQEFTLSVKTIESHRQTIKHKLGLATNSQLLQYAMKWFSGGTQRS